MYYTYNKYFRNILTLKKEFKCKRLIFNKIYENIFIMKFFFLTIVI